MGLEAVGRGSACRAESFSRHDQASPTYRCHSGPSGHSPGPCAHPSLRLFTLHCVRSLSPCSQCISHHARRACVILREASPVSGHLGHPILPYCEHLHADGSQLPEGGYMQLALTSLTNQYRGLRCGTSGSGATWRAGPSQKEPLIHLQAMSRSWGST